MDSNSLKIPVFVALLLGFVSNEALADYPSLPRNHSGSRHRRCPAQDQFGSDHFFNYNDDASWAIHKRFCPQDTGRYTRRLVRSGQPNRQGVQCYKSLHITHVFDLRRNGEVRATVPREETLVRGAEINYQHVPLSSYGHRVADASWRDELRPGDSGRRPVTGHLKAEANANAIMEVVESTRRILDDNPNARIAYHCFQGKDRTGAVMAAAQAILGGCTRQQVAREMQYFRFHEYASLSNAMRIVYKKYGINGTDSIADVATCGDIQAEAQPLTTQRLPQLPSEICENVNQDSCPDNVPI